MRFDSNQMYVARSLLLCSGTLEAKHRNLVAKGLAQKKLNPPRQPEAGRLRLHDTIRRLWALGGFLERKLAVPSSGLQRGLTIDALLS